MSGRIAKIVEQALLDRIVYIGDEIPDSVAADQRPKFVLLGMPQKFIDELVSHLAAVPGSADQPKGELWGWRDSRTNKRVSVSCVNTREQAERELAGWRERDRKGGRPDLHDLMPFVEVCRLEDAEDWR